MSIDVHAVLEAFHPSLFLPQLEAHDKTSVLRELVARVHGTGIVRDPDLLLEMLLQREALGSTGIGHGVAVPHGRSLAVPRLTAAFGRHPTGVAWDAVDGQPVKIVFLVLAPPLERPNRYLPFLGRIVELVGDAGRRQALEAPSSFESFQEKMRAAVG